MTVTQKNLLKAFTLLEVLIALALFTVMLLALVRFFISYNTSYGFERVLVSTSHSANVLMDEITGAVLPADQVMTTHTFSGITHSSDASTLVVELPSIDNTGAVIAGSYDYIAFYADGVRVYEVIDADAASSRTSRVRLLSDTISGLSFSYDNISFPSVTSVTVDLTTSASYKTQNTESHLREQVYLRNLSGS